MFSQAFVSHTVWGLGWGGISGTNVQGSGFVQMSRRAGMFGGWECPDVQGWVCPGEGRYPFTPTTDTYW